LDDGSSQKGDRHDGALPAHGAQPAYIISLVE
jgi:hypothetical protein